MGGYFKTIKEARERYGIEGITFTGGEPFLQAGPLSLIAQASHEIGLSVVSFTGYTLKELDFVLDAALLLEQVDLLLSGPYEKDKPETQRHWVGSSNQIFCYLTDKYKSGIEISKNREIIGPLDFSHKHEVFAITSKNQLVR